MEYLIEKVSGFQPVIVDKVHAKFDSILVSKEELRKGDVALFGIPFEGMTYNPVGARAGPKGIREAFETCRPYNSILKMDITETIRVADIGNIDVEPLDYDETFRRIDGVLKEVLKQGWVPIILGGSHTITEGTVKTFSKHFGGKIGLLWLDAHPDTMESYHGDIHFCGCPLIRLIEDGAVRAENVVHIGIRGFTNSKATIDKIDELGVNVFNMDFVRRNGIDQTIEKALKIVKDGTKAFYTTLDIDVVEGGLVPGTQSPNPGGLMPLEIMEMARKASLAGSEAFDIVCVAPPVDVAQMTTKLAASLVLEMMTGVAYRSRK